MHAYVRVHVHVIVVLPYATLWTVAQTIALSAVCLIIHVHINCPKAIPFCSTGSGSLYASLFIA